MKDHPDIDERIGELLRRELPVPEHREGYRERVAARITAEAPAVTRASRKKWMPDRRGPVRLGSRSGLVSRSEYPRRSDEWPAHRGFCVRRRRPLGGGRHWEP